MDQHFSSISQEKKKNSLQKITEFDIIYLLLLFFFFSMENKI